MPNKVTEHDDQKLDDTIEQTFPASDAPANTVETGIRLGTAAPPAVRDNPQASRFEIEIDGQVAFLKYRRTPASLALVHTEVPDALRGRKIGDALAKAGIEAARAEKLELSSPARSFARTSKNTRRPDRSLRR